MAVLTFSGRCVVRSSIRQIGPALLLLALLTTGCTPEPSTDGGTGGGQSWQGGTGPAGSGGVAGPTTGGLGGAAAGSAGIGGAPPCVASKEQARYREREVFLATDADWHEVLVAIPVAIWTEPVGHITQYPLLVVHDESGSGRGFDADSVALFLKQYGPARVSTLSSLPAALEDRLHADYETTPASAPLAYWSCWPRVVVVADDYALGLLAAPYASLLNAPLIIENHDDQLDLRDKQVVCVGVDRPECDELLDRTELEKRYLESTGTDRAILARPAFDRVVQEAQSNTLSPLPTERLFANTALGAPILAAAKHELLLLSSGDGVDEVDAELDAELAALGVSPRYLTLVASPLEIEQTTLLADNRRWSIDNTRYGNLDHDAFGFAEAKVGRIYGFSTSDVSAYVARAIFHPDMPRGKGCLFIGQVGGGDERDAAAFAQLFALAGYPASFKTTTDPVRPEDWRDQALIQHVAHGSTAGAAIGSGEIPELSNTIVFNSSCDVCAFDKLSTGSYGSLFCLHLLRQGALGVTASVDLDGYNWSSTRLNRVLSEDLGAVFKTQQNLDHARNKWYVEKLEGSHDYSGLQADIQFLLGDPTVRPQFGAVMLPASTQTIGAQDGGIAVRLDVVSHNVAAEGDVFSILEGTDDPSPAAKYSHCFVRVGPMTLPSAFSVSSPDVDPVFFGGILAVATQTDLDGSFVYLLLEKDLSANPLNTTASNRIEVQFTP